MRTRIPRARSAVARCFASSRLREEAARRVCWAVSAARWAERMRVRRARKAVCSAEGELVVLLYVGDVRAKPRVTASRASVWRWRWRRARAER